MLSEQAERDVQIIRHCVEGQESEGTGAAVHEDFIVPKRLSVVSTVVNGKPTLSLTLILRYRAATIPLP